MSDRTTGEDQIVKGRPETTVDIDQTVVDTDAHIRETVEDLLPYVEDEEARGYIESPYFEYPWDGWDRLLFATDWPHWDFDSPSVVQDTVPREHWSKVYHENATEAFGL